jgi:hypothetical protein
MIKKGNRKTKYIAAAILYLLLLAAVIALSWSCGRKNEEDTSELTKEDISEEIEDVSDGDISDADTVVYEPPEYNFKLDEITVEIEGIENSYDIAFVNDLHLITDHKAGDVLEENLTVVSDRYETLSVTPEGLHAEELWPEIVKFLNYNDFDAVIFGGDMLDYSSHSNIDVFALGIEDLKYTKDRILYIRSDHDYGGWYGGGVYTDTDGFIAQSKLWDGDDGCGCIEFGEFRIVGVNKSYQNLSDERLEFLEEKLQDNEPVIVATHVPFYSDEDKTLEEVSMEIRNRIYYWNKEDSSYCPDDNTQKFIDEMYSDESNVVQILAAHMHGSWDGEVSNGLKEHIFAPSFEGNIGVIHVVPASTGGEESNQ